jgi:hypothetical protein
MFDQFTNLYALSKTLRFELKPVGKTRENMNEHLKFDKDLQTFMADQEIEDAYQTLKPVLDALHEKFINDSLELEECKNIDFSGYLEKYRNKKDLKDKDFESLEKALRVIFAGLYERVGENWKKNAGLNEKGKPVFTEKSFKILTKKGVLVYVSKNMNDFVDLVSAEKLEGALRVFERFFTYFGGFNLNRENYYETGKEATTAVASRVVHENLPKFCDNLIVYELRAQDYLDAHELLRAKGINLVTKDGESLTPISREIFSIGNFSECLSQVQIENYNMKIGNANFVINLYNQAFRENSDFKKLSPFKTLYKQIGCGEKKALFFELTHNTKVEADKVRGEGKEAFSVEEVLHLAKLAGEKYFQGKSDDGMINTVPELLDYIGKRADYKGIYWSKTAINTISSKYLANWHDFKDKLKDEKVFVKNKKGSEEDVKIPDAVELEGLFMVLNKWQDWKTTLFKSSVIEDLRKKELVKKSVNASTALLALIFADINDHVKCFSDGAKEILKIQDYKKEENKNLIKLWMDHALAVSQMLKYFSVREKKIKGAPLDATIVEALKSIVPGKADVFYDKVGWFKWYDSLRNYLTKKPQDDAKRNKLKLNFECSSLLGGWSDGQEKIKGAVLLKKENFYYLGILKKKNLFDTEKDNNPVYQSPTIGAGRLILANLKFQTLAGKGFLGEFGKAYGDMGVEDPDKAIECLKKIIKDRYEEKYPLLARIAATHYSDKKVFDKDIQETLKECYVCRFEPVSWIKVEEYVDDGELYLFQIYSKDFATNNTGKNDLQTLYWKAIFDEDSSFQLNGGGEMFYRKQAIKEKTVKVGYEGKPWVIANKRFTLAEGKFAFHCPIKINYRAKNYSQPKSAFSEINKIVNDGFDKLSNTYFLGIDRGEKHLAYYCLVDRNGKIVEQGTLNMPFVDANGNPRMVKIEKKSMKDGKEHSEVVECKDYNELLEARAGDRDYARKNWQTIGTIKELKEGYISQVVRKIADLCTDEEHPAFIVLEDLNTGFKRGRQKIEKSVYQKFELALAKKLNFLVDKSAKSGEVGSVTNALQLTPPVNNYGDIENRKQVGIMLYTRANYTSQTDPKTGWRKSIYLKTGSEGNIKEQIVENFSEILFDGKDYVFVYKDANTGKEWRLYSGINGKSLDRYRGKRGDKNEWSIERQDIMSILDGVFVKFDKDRSLLSQIVDEGKELTKTSEHTAWESLRFAIELIQQIRNTGVIPGDNDFLLSPVRDPDGNHFDSRVFLDKEQKGDKIDLPSSGDANGAYNIARKGLVMNEHIKRGYGLYISDSEWDAWLTGTANWENWIKENEKLLKPNKK